MSSMISEYGLPETADMMSGIVLQQLISFRKMFVQNVSFSFF